MEVFPFCQLIELALICNLFDCIKKNGAKHLLVHAEPLAGVPSYPLLHLQSWIVLLPSLSWPELSGHFVHDF